jgi:hypothetical protein
MALILLSPAKSSPKKGKASTISREKARRKTQIKFADSSALFLFTRYSFHELSTLEGFGQPANDEANQKHRQIDNHPRRLDAPDQKVHTHHFHVLQYKDSHKGQGEDAYKQFRVHGGFLGRVNASYLIDSPDHGSTVGGLKAMGIGAKGDGPETENAWVCESPAFDLLS